jgi:hypothetical protein
VAIPETFNQMVVDEPGGTLRLEATWTNDGTPAGDIEQSVWLSQVCERGQKRKMSSSGKADQGRRSAS